MIHYVVTKPGCGDMSVFALARHIMLSIWLAMETRLYLDVVHHDVNMAGYGEPLILL